MFVLQVYGLTIDLGHLGYNMSNIIIRINIKQSNMKKKCHSMLNLSSGCQIEK